MREAHSTIRANGALYVNAVGPPRPVTGRLSMLVALAMVGCADPTQGKVERSGAPDPARTDHPLFTKQALCPMSYGGLKWSRSNGRDAEN